MAEFEELRLTVNLVDNASTGLAKIRTELVNLTQTAGQMTTSFTQATASATALGNAALTAGPRLRTISTELSALSRNAADTGRSLAQMGNAAQQGLSGLPRLAVGLWDAAEGVNRLGESMKNIPGVSQAAVVGLGRLAIGVAAIGLVAVAYGISVFKFAKEMDQLGRTARTLGMSFAELKYAQDQAKAFGHSAELITRSFQGIQAAQFDLYKNNSQLRQKLISQGVDANWVNQLAAVEPAKARQMIAQYGKALEKQALEAGWGKSVAAALANQFWGDFGQTREGMELELKPVSPEKAREMAEVAASGKRVSEIWGEISLKLKGITFSALSAGLPVLLGALRLADDLFGAIGRGITYIDEQLPGLGVNLVELLKGIPLLGQVITVIQGLNKLGALKSSDATQPDMPGATPQSYTPPGETNPLLQPASFTTDELIDETGQNTEQTEKLTGQLDRLNNYFERMEDRSTGSQGGGVQKASYSPPGGGGTGSGAGSPTGGAPTGAPTSGGTAAPSSPSSEPPSSGSTTAAPSGPAAPATGGDTAAPSGGGGTPSAAPAPSSGGTAPSAAPAPSGAASAPTDSAPFTGSMKDRIAGLKSIMGEVQEAGMTTTSGYRGPDHRLTKRNPNSAHAKALAFDTRARTTAQVDAAMAKQREIFARHGMVEGRDYKFRDEVRNPVGYATGKHLHTQLTPQGAKRYAQSKAAQESKVAGIPEAPVFTPGDAPTGPPEAAPFTPGDLDREALDRKALSDTTSVRADGTVKVDVGAPAKPKGSARAKLFQNTPLQRSEAGQNTQSGPNAYDTADNYLYQNI